MRTTACVDLVAASGGYMLACTAHTIVAAPFAMVGSIGVIAGAPNASQPLALPWPCLGLTTLRPCSIWLWRTMRPLGAPNVAKLLERGGVDYVQRTGGAHT